MVRDASKSQAYAEGQNSADQIPTGAIHAPKSTPTRLARRVFTPPAMNAATAARQQVQAPSPPPTAHTLKPHHIHLLWAIWVLNRSGTEQSDLPKTWLLHMYRVILVEVAEVAFSLSGLCICVNTILLGSTTGNPRPVDACFR